MMIRTPNAEENGNIVIDEPILDSYRPKPEECKNYRRTW